MQLNTQQKTAVTASITGIHLVQALAGSGKTTLLRHRTRYLLRAREQAGEFCSSVLLMAFNKDVKQTLEDKLQLDLTNTEYERVSVRTFHGQAMYMVQKFRRFIPGLASEINIPKPGHLTTVSTDWLKSKGYKLRASQVKLLLGLDAESSNLNKTIKELFLANPKLMAGLKLDHGEAQECINQLREFRVSSGNLTYGDLLPLANSLPDEAFKSCGYDDLLVDELQDLNHQQRTLVRRLVPFAKQFTGVGDPRQSIYSFQGCDDKIFDRLVQEYPHAKVYPLTTNYRCADPIISLANKVLTHDLGSPDLLVGTGKSGPSPLVMLGTDGLVEWIKSQRASGRNWKDIAILYRARNHTPELEVALSQASIPFTVSSSSFFDQPVVQDILAYFYLVYHPKPDYGYWRHVCNHFASIPVQAVEAVWDKTKGYPLTYKGIRPYGVQEWAWRRLVNGLDDIKVLASNPEAMCRRITDHLYDRWSYLYGHDLNILNYYMEIAEAFCDWVAGYGADGFRVIQTIELREAGEAEEEDSVQVITVHKSKGREWPCVAIWSLKDGLFPHSMADQDEERRLLYVAVTRAQEELALIGLDQADRKSTLIRHTVDVTEGYEEMFYDPEGEV